MTAAAARMNPAAVPPLASSAARTRARISSTAGTCRRGHEEVVVRVEQRRALAVHRRERLAGVQVERRLLRHHHRLRLDAQAAMLGHDVEVVHPVAEVVARGRRRRGGLGPQPEPDAGLELVVDRLQVDLVVALGNRAVVLELGDVEEPVAVHVPTS